MFTQNKNRINRVTSNNKIPKELIEKANRLKVKLSQSELHKRKFTSKSKVLDKNNKEEIGRKSIPKVKNSLKAEVKRVKQRKLKIKLITSK